ncbi:Ribosomal RNA small subunit methyltransferase G [Candidatus Defluviicoccus seviourii]|uniref:Ribosomal RNA small subunit methyltransferase G n=2 Tax=root TaxID=1 RepID=A0A564WC31_9PROT|nr:Ribosomal RNA small subunit methyltransferase G [uncultured Defluviicoccus sp.]VUX46060.1 Ribosomal RNA small subunit methyltransferase G [Candidatus Defluviicoccus seviourii]
MSAAPAPLFHVKQAGSNLPPLTAPEFQALSGCTGSEIARLTAYLDVLIHWQRRINLVGASTLADPWRRHILDSQQLVPLLPVDAQAVTDLGSGGGFPGLVIAILTAARVTLVEADQRKAAFLAAAARVSETDVAIACQRMETLAPGSADVVTARACAPLPRLLSVIARILRPNGVALLLKGQTGQVELTQTEKHWKMRSSMIASRSDPGGVILQLQDIQALP